MQKDFREHVVDVLSTQHQNMKQRRVVNAANAVDLQDYVTLDDLQNALADSQVTTQVSSGNLIYSGTHALRVKFNTVRLSNRLYYETDRAVYYICYAPAYKWVYSSGVSRATQATIPADLTTTDVGFLCWVTDYNHLLEWNGTAWQWGPGEGGSGSLQHFAIAPTGNGWHVCDGSSVNYLKSDGTLGTVTLPNTSATAAFIKNGAAFSATITAAQTPSATNPANTGDHALSIAEMPVHAHGLSQLKYAINYTRTASSVGILDIGTSLTQTTDNAGSGSVHSHSLSNPTVSLPGDPIANFAAILYFRK